MLDGDGGHDEGGGKRKFFTEREVKALIGFFAGVTAGTIVTDPEDFLDADDADAADRQANYALAIFEFGKRRNWPPAEAFWRQTCELNRAPADPAQWQEPRVRARFETMRATMMALADVPLGIDPPPAPIASTRVIRPPRDGIFERTSGAFERDRIGPRAPGIARTTAALDALEPQNAATTEIKGVGQKTADKLAALGVTTAGALAAINPATFIAQHGSALGEMKDRLAALVDGARDWISKSSKGDGA